jgi:solute carrier family 35 protein E1
MPEYNMGLFGKIICLYIIWCAGSTGSNISTKKALSLLPYPLTVSMVHLLTMNCLLYPILILFNVPPLPHLKKNFYVKRIIPLVIGRGFAAIASNISLWRIPISYAHTIKVSLLELSHLSCIVSHDRL